MIDGRKVLAVVPARGGSKGVQLKNIRELHGRPLIAWTIECAAASKYIDRCIVTTDDEEIAEVSRRYGGDVPFIRPSELARDDTPGMAPVLHAIEMVPGFDLIVLLQPTSPLRIAEDIDGCLERLMSSAAPFCVSVTVPDKSPYWMFTLDGTGEMKPLLEIEDRNVSRQKLPEVYVLNGAVYVANIDSLVTQGSFVQRETLAYVMPRERSLDIDSLKDFAMAEWQISSNG